jgi:isopentenyldiphosphate isomerase
MSQSTEEELFDVLDIDGNLTGKTCLRSEVHRLGLFHRAVHVWLFCPSTGELLLQKRASIKDSWPDRWDISCAGHVTAGEESRPSAQRELLEELGFYIKESNTSRLEFLFVHLEMLDSVQRGKPFLNHEFNDVYLLEVTEKERSILTDDNFELVDSISSNMKDNSKWLLQQSEVSCVKWLPYLKIQELYRSSDSSIVPLTSFDSYNRLFLECEKRLRKNLTSE